jgi:hypothetical protein
MFIDCLSVFRAIVILTPIVIRPPNPGNRNLSYAPRPVEAAITRSSYPAKISRAVHSARAQIQGIISAEGRAALEDYAAARTRSAVNVNSPRANVALWGRERPGGTGSITSRAVVSLRAPTVGGLPPPHTQRWVARRKAAVVAAVRSGMITMEEVLRPYQLTEEEFHSWPCGFEAPRACGFARHVHPAILGSRPPRDPDRNAEDIVGLRAGPSIFFRSK